MAKNRARTAEDQGPASRDADRGRPQYAARAEAPAEGQERRGLKAAYFIPECKNPRLADLLPQGPTPAGVPTQAASARRPRRGPLIVLAGHTQKPPRSPSTARAVAFTWRCAASSGARTRCLFLFGRTASIRRLVRCQCAGPTTPDNVVCVTGADADQASAAVLTMKWLVR
jgi:hypothetical protein